LKRITKIRGEFAFKRNSSAFVSDAGLKEMADPSSGAPTRDAMRVGELTIVENASKLLIAAILKRRGVPTAVG
jgi:hypothetical protein